MLVRYHVLYLITFATIQRNFALPLQSFSSVGTPYEAHHMDFLADKASDESKRVADQAFSPACTSKVSGKVRHTGRLNQSNFTQVLQAYQGCLLSEAH